MKIFKLGDEILRQKCEPVFPEEIDDRLRATFDEMFKTMTSADGVGLAAPQIGVLKRYFVLIADDKVRRVFINPQIIKTSLETASYEEGCLSLPGFSEKIIRPVRISVSAFNEFGKPFTLNDIDGLLARIIQHENDHLDGIMYIDRVAEARREEIAQKFKQRQERAAQKLAKKRGRAKR